MRFIGNKENVVEMIDYTLQQRNICGKVFFDFFAGTSNVGRYFKKKNYKIISADLLYFSYCLQKAYIVNNQAPTFDKLLNFITNDALLLFDTPLKTVIRYLNNLEGIEGFIYQHYTPKGTSNLTIPRMYFIPENGKKIDAIRQQIEMWKLEEKITENEYFILIACLLETVSFYTNVSGVYAAFQKTWDPRAIKPFVLRNIELIENELCHQSFNINSIELIEKINCDILYLDPPYNQRQYAPNYHLLETIAKYDNPIIKGVAGLRNYENQKSEFCNAKTAIIALEKIAAKAKYKYLVLSYNSEGIMSQTDILAVFEKYGTVELVEFDYLRFKSNNNGLSKEKKIIQEQLYILIPKV